MNDIDQAITRLAAAFDGAAHLDHAISRGCSDGGRYIHGHPDTWRWSRTRDSIDQALTPDGQRRRIARRIVERP